MKTMRNFELFASWLAVALAQMFGELESTIAPAGVLPMPVEITTSPEVASATPIGAPRRLPITELPALPVPVPVPVPHARAAATRHAATNRFDTRPPWELRGTSPAAGARPGASNSQGRRDPQFDEVENLLLQRNPRQGVDLDQPRGARHVHLGEPAPDDVETHQVQPEPLQLGAQPCADLAVARVHL